MVRVEGVHEADRPRMVRVGPVGGDRAADARGAGQRDDDRDGDQAPGPQPPRPAAERGREDGERRGGQTSGTAAVARPRVGKSRVTSGTRTTTAGSAEPMRAVVRHGESSAARAPRATPAATPSAVQVNTYAAPGSSRAVGTASSAGHTPMPAAVSSAPQRRPAHAAHRPVRAAVSSSRPVIAGPVRYGSPVRNEA